MKTNNKYKQDTYDKYLDLTIKLGKFPTKRECIKFGLKDKIEYNYETLGNLRAAILKDHPELEYLHAPPKVNMADIESYRLELLKKENKKSNKLLVDNVNTFDYIADFAKTVFAGKVKNTSLPKKNFKAKRVHTLVLSDLHFGADIKKEETGVSDYGTVEEARRFAAVIKQATSYKSQYRKNTKLVVALLGDIIENAMHDPRTGDEIAIQVCRAIHLLVQGITYLANHYPEVQVVCATGNHDRNTSRHHGRAVHGKYDSFSTIIYFALKSALSGLKHITFDIPKSPMSHYEVFGKRIAYSHGDTVLNPGNPYTSVNVKGLTNQVNEINASLPDHHEYAAFLYGHTHIAHIIHLPNGSVLIGNGSLPPSDPFSVSLGKFESNNGQWIFESVENHPVGDMRLIKTGKFYEKDESLDSIIKPWTNL